MNKPLTFKQKILRFTKRHKKFATIHSIVALLIVGTILYFHKSFEYDIMAYDSDSKKGKEEEEELILTASMVGDIMFGRHTEKVAKRYGYDSLLTYVQPYFEDSDYVTGNFEHPVMEKEPREEFKWDKNHHYFTYPDAIKALEKANFTHVNGANDHILDYGHEGLEETVDLFNSSSVDLVGAGSNLNEASKIHYKEIGGVTIATIGLSSIYPIGFQAEGHSGGIFDHDPAVYVPIIREAKEKANLVFVHMHFGDENISIIPERQRVIAENLSQAGADVIIGHHSHVLGQFEVIGDTLVMYGLGNFIFDQGLSKNRDSVIAQYKLFKDGRARLEFIPVRIREATPRPLDESFLRSYHRNRIFKTLSRGYEGENMKIEDNRLIFEFDHSRVLSEKES